MDVRWTAPSRLTAHNSSEIAHSFRPDFPRADEPSRRVCEGSGVEGAHRQQRSGHSTYRIRLSDSVGIEDLTFDRYWQPIEAAGCTYERAAGQLLAVDVPASADIHRVYALLTEAEEDGVVL